MIAQIKKPIEIPVEDSTNISTGLSKNYSVEEYLAIEVESEFRNEYRDGEIVPMAGGLPCLNRYHPTWGSLNIQLVALK